jgi:transcriptional regulator with XRE-family HTH domain
MPTSAKVTGKPQHQLGFPQIGNRLSPLRDRLHPNPEKLGNVLGRTEVLNHTLRLNHDLNYKACYTPDVKHPSSCLWKNACMTKGERIQQRREELGYSVQQLAKACGVTRAAVYQWESGETEPSADSLVEIASYLRVRERWIVTGEEPKEGMTEAEYQQFIRFRDFMGSMPQRSSTGSEPSLPLEKRYEDRRLSDSGPPSGTGERRKVKK